MRMGGRLGIFYQGHLEIELTDGLGHVLQSRTLVRSVSPLSPVILDAFPISAPPSATAIRIVLYDKTAKRLGELARAKISQE